MRNKYAGVVAAILTVAAFIALAVLQSVIPAQAQESAAQVALQQKLINAGPQAQGAGVFQTGEVNTLSAAVASATRTQVIAAPASGSIYLRGLFIEKSTSGTGSIIVSTGTGTNCGTSNAVITTLSAASGQTFSFGFLRMEIQVPALGALCLATDASTTSVRAIGQ